MQPSDAAASSRIGAIYECAIDPASWPRTLDAMCVALDCHIGSLSILDRMADPPRLSGRFVSSRADAAWIAHHAAANYAADFIAFFELATSQPGVDPDQPLVVSHVLPPEAIAKMRVVSEFAAPQGFSDCMSIVVHDAPHHFVTVDFIRHERQGMIGEAQVAGLRSFAPHLRRAAAISSLLDMRTLETAALSTALDGVGSAIVIVDSGARVLRTNSKAAAMLSSGRLLCVHDGRVSAADASAGVALQRQIAHIGTNAAAALDGVTPVRLSRTDDGSDGETGDAVLAHVLPLDVGLAPSSSLAPRAVAAIVVRDGSDPPNGHADFAAIHRLTPAETRLLKLLLGGASVAEAAAVLEVSIATTRTHLARIFAKTGTKRQGELIARVARLET